MTSWQNKSSTVFCHYIFICLLLSSAALLPLWLSSCATAGHTTKQVSVRGKIAIRGNEPFVFLTISNDTAEYRITGKLEEQLRKHQGRTVTLRGILTKDSSEKQNSLTKLPQLKVSSLVSIEGE
ncbi:hypothetical protein P0082_12215 [Candidatus Haliotispira prima]|uniref:Uncharacterized protein n=1 Tax=Candidatus Haliotispira prima TaxID=3034016 RepID=A0ABY8MGT4_9SPIO|nr:hypothetical protein P0082_12215 [Candidatus Haliotispira prima]